MKWLTVNKGVILKKALLSALTVTVAVALPWLCHLVRPRSGGGILYKCLNLR